VGLFFCEKSILLILLQFDLLQFDLLQNILQQTNLQQILLQVCHNFESLQQIITLEMNELENLRKMLQASQEDMSKFFQIDRGRYSMIEAGRREKKVLDPTFLKLLQEIIKDPPKPNLATYFTEKEKIKMERTVSKLKARITLSTLKFEKASQKRNDLNVAIQLFARLNPSHAKMENDRKLIQTWKELNIAQREASITAVNDFKLINLELAIKQMTLEVEHLEKLLAQGFRNLQKTVT
jgi:transcriptional regulator with XRE-family HTH domain